MPGDETRRSNCIHLCGIEARSVLDDFPFDIAILTRSMNYYPVSDFGVELIRPRWDKEHPPNSRGVVLAFSRFETLNTSFLTRSQLQETSYFRLHHHDSQV